MFEADDAAGLAGAVRRLAGDEALRERLRQGGLATARGNTDTTFHRAVESAPENRSGADKTWVETAQKEFHEYFARVMREN